MSSEDVAGDASQLTSSTTIGVQMKGETWNCVEIDDSRAFLGTVRAARVDAPVDEVPLVNVGAMATGTGGRVASLSAHRRWLREGVGARP